MANFGNGYQEVVSTALEILTAGLRDFVRTQLELAFGDEWLDVARSSFRSDRNFDELSADINAWDAHALLTVMWDQWNSAFRRKLGLFERSLVAELRAFRNRWAHQRHFNFDDTYRFLDSICRLLSEIGVPCASDLSELKFELLKYEFAEAINVEAMDKDNSRDRWAVAGVYLACGAVFVYLICSISEKLWPLGAAFGIAFLYLIYRRIKWKPQQVGPHECRRCRRIIYGTKCPYCIEPSSFDNADFRLGAADGDSSESNMRRVPR